MAESLMNDVHQEFAFNAREAERLLMDIAREGRTEFLTSERAFLSREMGWTPDDCKRELRRVRSILRLQGIAGSPADREAALQECQVSTDLLAKRGDKIREQIEKLQSELAGLERDASTSQRRCEQQSEAVQQLRGYCPQDIRERVRQAVRVVEAGIGQELRDAKARHQELRCILNVDNAYESQDRHLEWGLQRLLPAAVDKRIDSGRVIRLHYSAAWPALREECQAEFAALCERLPALQAEYDEQIRQAELPLAFYADPQNLEKD